jgi:serine/threonine protein kinase
VERPPEQRGAFLAAATGDDAALRREVESLLASDTSHVGFLDRLPVAGGSAITEPLAALAASVDSTLSHTGLAAGRRVGPYEIVAPLGAGAMGEVYRARDTKLNRSVALKVLPERFALDPDRSARFTREAQLLATLNHPNIGAIYGLEESTGAQALVLELIEGPTLADRLVRGPMSLDEALTIARQIAEALDAAHQKGIIHRDLKPANIKIARDGVVKVLDFGLAKVWDGAPQADVSASPTLTATGLGGRTILGTPAYMSPEQARGQSLDKRTDIWSFGCVLYEILTGRAPFAGDTISDTLAAILEREPDLTALPATVPAAVRTLIRRCLEKDGRQRIADISVAQFVLDHPAEQPPSDAAPTASLRLWQGLAALCALIALGLVGWTVWSNPSPGHTSRFAAPLPENATFYAYVSVSPDGRKLVFTDGGAAGNARGLWIRDFSTLEWRRLPGTELAASPFWSPDSRYLGFAAGNQLKKIDITGGPPQTLCSVPVRIEGSGSWNRNGVIVFGSWGGGAGGPLWKTSETGGEATAITQLDASKGESYHTWPTFTEDGEHFVYFRSGPPEVEGIYVGSIDAKPVEQSRERILATEFAPSYANGYLFFIRANTLLGQKLDLRSVKLTGEAVPVTEALETTWFRTGVFSVSSGGTLAYRTRAASGDLQLTWLDRQGERLSTVGPPDQNAQVSLSPDGSRAVVRDAFYGQTGDLWMVDLAKGRRTRLTFLRSNYSPAVWSPDGSRIAFAGGNFGDTLYEKASSGVGDDKVLLTEPGTRHYPTSWSSDGRFLLYYNADNAPKTGNDLWVLPLQGDRKPQRLLSDAFNEWAAVFSPDTRWIAYASTETGGANVYVRPFLAVGPSGVPAVGEGKWQVSKDGGNWPKWIGKEILLNDVPSGTSEFAVGVSTNGAVFESGIPQRLFNLGSFQWGDFGGLEVSPDAQRFLWAGPQAQRTTQVPITVVLNWQEELKQRMPKK